MKVKNQAKFFWLLSAAMLLMAMAVLSGCGGGNPAGSGNSTPANRGALVSSPLLATVASATAQTFFTNNALPFTAKYDVKIYKITYKTVDAAGNLINASGLVVVPQKTGSATSPLASLQHGTITLDTQAPSYGAAFIAGQPSYGDMSAGLASLGYVVAAPDFVGFGASNTLLHPYVHASTLASATIDMLRSTKAFLQQNNIATNGQLFLAGYSEGGYATLAAQKEIETNLAAEFTITASEPGAGPYNMTDTAKALMASANLPVPSYVAFVFKSYDSLYNNPSNVGTYFQAAYVNFVNMDFNGTKDIPAIDTDLGGANVATNVLFNPAFLANFNGAGEAVLKANIAKNDIYNWQPKTPTHLFHGQQDTVVPYANTASAAAVMGANATVVNCAGVAPTDHTQCAGPFFVDATTYFGTLATGL